MNSENIKRGFTIDSIDLEAGVIIVTYTCETEEGPLPPLTLSMGLPLGDKIKDKDFVIEYVKLSYPEDEFQRQKLVKRYDIPEYIKTDLEHLTIPVEEEDLKSKNETTPSAEEPFDKGKSIYGNEYSVIAMRHVIIETLEELGLLK